jgi:hypothetical protein
VDLPSLKQHPTIQSHLTLRLHCTRSFARSLQGMHAQMRIRLFLIVGAAMAGKEAFGQVKQRGALLGLNIGETILNVTREGIDNATD